MIDELVLVDIHIPEEAFQQNVFVRKEMIQVEAMQVRTNSAKMKMMLRTEREACLANLGCRRPPRGARCRNIQRRMPVLEVSQGCLNSPSLISRETITLSKGVNQTRGGLSRTQGGKNQTLGGLSRTQGGVILTHKEE
jgi:hypothetical protein